MKQTYRRPFRRSHFAALLVFLTASPLLAATSSTTTQPTTTTTAPAATTRASSRTTLKSVRKGTSTILPTEGAPRVRRAVKAKVEDRVGIQAPKFGDYTLAAELKNTMTMGRKEELETVGGKNFFLLNELVLGVKHKSGWGVAVSEAIWQTNSNSTTKDSRGNYTDASIAIGHPALYKSDALSIGGKFRGYLPTSQTSRQNDKLQFRYYSFADITMPKNWGLSHVLMPKWVSANNMNETSSDWYVYESLELTHQTAKTVRFGFGEQTQWEHHLGTAAGTVVEVYPFVDIEWIPNVLIEPKVYLPVLVSNAVGDAPSVVALSQLQAELFVKIGF